MRSKLFVPASRPELFAKALAGNADAISFDLEDAVEESRKADARAQLETFLSGVDPMALSKVLIVRVNALPTVHFAADLRAVIRPGLSVLNLPMVESADDVRAAARLLDQAEQEREIKTPIRILANIESPRGLRLAADIAASHPRLMGLQLGFGDLFAPLGIDPADEAACHAVRLAVRLAAGESKIDAYDGAYTDLADPQGFRRSAAAAASLGYAGKTCIHPSQVELANEAFRPGRQEIEHALRVVRAASEKQAAGIGAFVVDGKLVDGPLIERATELLARARKLDLLNPIAGKQ